MTRHIILGNGNMLACFDKDARIRDFYYPFVGQENHVSSNHHRTGVWVDGKFSWISASEWQISLRYKKDSLVSEVIAYNEKLDVELKINEAVHPEKNVLVKKVYLTNKADKAREIKLFFSQHFHISETNIGDTVYYNPILDSIIHYKGRRYFLMGGITNEKKSFDQFATGNSGESGREGTWIDAEDGHLSKNTIEHGSVDSTIGFTLNFEKNQTKEIDYWICVGKKHHDIKTLKDFIIKKGCKKILEETESYWIKWLERRNIKFHHLSSEVQDHFKRSLLIVRAQTDNNGAIIAANDTHTFHFKKDTYSYMWPRDGALIARSLDRVGLHEVTGRFFGFCADIITEEGYFLHKYRPDGSFGSSWHSWLQGSKLQLPIQEDETALILDALWKHHAKRPMKNSKEIILHGLNKEKLSTHTEKDYEGNKMIKEMYNKFIKPAGDFLEDYRDPKTNLPKPSYDLWEEKLGVHTFTCSTVYAGLIAAKNFAEEFGKKADVEKYAKAAEEVREAILKNLYDEESETFFKGIYFEQNDSGSFETKKDLTIDISTGYGLFEYNILQTEDPRLQRTMKQIIDKLWNTHGSGGIARYVGDMYYQTASHAPENPWFISTMWLAQYHIAKAKSPEELKDAEKLLEWAAKRALPSGVMSEQINPFTGGPLSVAPLTWSHSSFVVAVDKYLNKFEKLSK